MDLNSLFCSLSDIRDTSSRNEKEGIIQEILLSENKDVFTYLVKFIFNPYRKLNVKVTSSMIDNLDPPESIPSDDEVWCKFTSLLDKLESGDLSGGKARRELSKFLSNNDFEYAEWFAMFFNKNWKIGVGRPTIEKFLPEFSPRFEVQLCSKYSGFDFHHPYYVQPKLDGLRGVAGRFPGKDGRVILTRNGKPTFNTELILESLDLLNNSFREEMVFDGELYAGSWERSISICRRSKSAAVNPEDLKYYVFDAIPLSEWVAGKCSSPLSQRVLSLETAFSHISCPCLVNVPLKVGSCESEVHKITCDYVEDGWEGSVLKDPNSLYTYDRSESWLKYKFVKEVDAKVVGVKLGCHDQVTNNIVDEDDSRGLGWNLVVRALIVDPGNGELTRVGSGLELNDRYNFYSLHMKEELVGKIVEVHFQDFTPDGKLLFPRYKRLREDKEV